MSSQVFISHKVYIFALMNAIMINLRYAWIALRL